MGGESVDDSIKLPQLLEPELFEPPPESVLEVLEVFEWSRGGC